MEDDLFSYSATATQEPAKKILFRITHAPVKMDGKQACMCEPLLLSAQEYNRFNAQAKSLPRAYFERSLGRWVFADEVENYQHLKRMFAGEYEVDPAIKVAMERAYAAPEMALWNYYFDKSKEIECAYESPLEPKRHQKLALNYIHNQQFFALIWDMGTGKSKVIVDECFWQAKECGHYRALIVCPKSLQYNWIREFEKNAPAGLNYYCAKIRTDVAGAQDVLRGISYDVPLHVFICSVDSVGSNLALFQALNLDLVALDESHKIKSHSSKRSKACLELSKLCKRRFILTGTPVANDFSDLFQQFEFLHHGLLGADNFNQFCNSFSWMGQRYKSIDKISKNASLKNLLSKVTLIVKKSECLDLPDKTYNIYDVDLLPEQRKVYEAVSNKYFAEFPDGSEISITNSAALIMKLAQICVGFVNTTLGERQRLPNPKLDALKELISGFNPDSKFLIWARFHYDAEIIAEFLRKEKVNFGVINGTVPLEQRDKIVQSFNRDSGIACIIGEAGSCGEGLTLVGHKDRPCQNAIFYNQDYSVIKRGQAEDRCHRIGMYTPVTYWDLICTDTIEQSIYDALQRKIELQNFIRDSSSIKKLIQGALFR